MVAEGEHKLVDDMLENEVYVSATRIHPGFPPSL